jgi:hypothetical protein
MANVTYTIKQLEAFTLAELKTLDLYSQINPKGLSKSEVVKAMFKAQKKDVKAPEIVEEIKSEVPKNTTEVDAVIIEEVIENNLAENDNKENEEVQSEKSEKVVFHRSNQISRNPMTFR